MQVFESDNVHFLNLPPDVPVLSLFVQKTGGNQEFMPWMETSAVAEIVTDRLIEVVKKDMNLSVKKPKNLTKSKPSNKGK